MNPKDIYHATQEQIRHHDTVLEGQKARARTLLSVGAVLLGIMAISLGNYAGFVQGNYDGVINDPQMLLVQAIAVTMMLGVAGLGGAMTSVIFSARALSVSYAHQPIMSENFRNGDYTEDEILDALVNMPEHETYMMLTKSCIQALRSREQDLDKIGARASMAQTSLLSGLVLAGTGAMVTLAVFVPALLAV